MKQVNKNICNVCFTKSATHNLILVYKVSTKHHRSLYSSSNRDGAMPDNDDKELKAHRKEEKTCSDETTASLKYFFRNHNLIQLSFYFFQINNHIGPDTLARLFCYGNGLAKYIIIVHARPLCYVIIIGKC